MPEDSVPSGSASNRAIVDPEPIQRRRTGYRMRYPESHGIRASEIDAESWTSGQPQEWKKDLLLTSQAGPDPVDGMH